MLGHARRYFFKALTFEPEQAGEAIALIGRLFGNERKCENLSAKNEPPREFRRADYASPAGAAGVLMS